MPINAMIFDLDGTLLQTEKLKALSYAKAAVELCPRNITEDEVLEAFKEVVGLSRREVATKLMHRFDLHDKAHARQKEFGVMSGWQAFVQVRLHYYNDLISDPNTLRTNQWSHNISLLEAARAQGCITALATMSHCEQVTRILDVLAMHDKFDFVATRDDVEYGKPDPEIYNLVANELSLQPQNTLVIEDSPSGAQAALNAGMHVIAVATPFTKEGLYKLSDLDHHFIVENPAEELLPRVREFVADFA
ncbi:MAG: HAD family phosphatase [Chloroflexota bacterium]